MTRRRTFWSSLDVQLQNHLKLYTLPLSHIIRHFRTLLQEETHVISRHPKSFWVLTYEVDEFALLGPDLVYEDLDKVWIIRD